MGVIPLQSWVLKGSKEEEEGVARQKRLAHNLLYSNNWIVWKTRDSDDILED